MRQNKFIVGKLDRVFLDNDVAAVPPDNKMRAEFGFLRAIDREDGSAEAEDGESEK